MQAVRDKQTILNERFENLVPANKRDRFLNTLAYEVLLFDTKREYDTCNTEAEFKKRLYAKFRFYAEALDYAERLAVCEITAYRVILRA